MRGVHQVVTTDSVVAVVADHYGAARKGLMALRVEWDEGPNATYSTQAMVADLEQASHHVLAETLVTLAREKALPLSQPTNVREYRGSGLEGIVDGKYVRAGSQSLVLGDASVPPWVHAVSQDAKSAALAIFVAVDGNVVACLIMADAVRPDAPEMLRHLRNAGVNRVLMVTGDDPGTAAAVAATLAIDEVRDRPLVRQAQPVVRP